MSNESEIFGGWVIDEKMQACPMPEKVASAFSEAVINLQGAEYMPVLYVGQQLVSGMNYMIICKQTLITQNSTVDIVKMTIYASLDKPAVIQSIETIL